MSSVNQGYNRGTKRPLRISRYIIRVSFSQERMTYIPEESNVIYQSKGGEKEMVFDVLEWLETMCYQPQDMGIGQFLAHPVYWRRFRA
jgi:hypothetical protein